MLRNTRARTVLLVSLMILAAFLANGLITFMNLTRIKRNINAVEHTHEVLDRLQALRIYITDAETGMRGYMLTAQDKFLEPYQVAMKSIHSTQQRIDDLTKDNSLQQQRALQLREQVDASLMHIQSAVQQRKAGQTEAAIESIRSGRGRRLMETIRTTLRDMEQAEYELLEQRDRETRSSYVTALSAASIATVLGILLTISAYFLIVGEMRRRDQAAQQLRDANDFLEHRVSERTAELSNTNSVMRSEIEERRRAEEQVRLFAEELQRSNRELEQFASVASHDLQEPLRKIQAFGDRLQARYRDRLGEQGQDYIDRMLASAKRMRGLIDDLLEYSRVTTKAQPFALVNLTEVVHEVSGDLETRLQQTGGRIEVSELPLVRASPLQMRQLFQNLIGNALKFHRPDEPPIVRVSAAMLENSTASQGEGETGLRCQIVVEDNGIGFEPEYGERIFDLFQRLHGKDEYEGTGIGLAICRKIVDRHNGHIAAESSPGSGARFLITLPMEHSQPKESLP